MVRKYKMNFENVDKNRTRLFSQYKTFDKRGRFFTNDLTSYLTAQNPFWQISKSLSSTLVFHEALVA